MTILLVIEAEATGLSETARRAFGAARQIGSADILVVGTACADTSAQAAKLDGVGKVFVAEGTEAEGLTAEVLAATVMGLSERYDGFAAAADSVGKNFMPRVAALLDVMQVSEIIAVESPTVFTRPVYAGNFRQTVEVPAGEKLVLTVRTSAFEPAALGTASAPIETVPLIVPETGTARFVSESLAGGERPDLATARIIVSGGRALGSKERFEETLRPLAERLNAAIGASRAAVDAGFVGNDLQVGQTGKIVAPDLYIAIGISGAIQHLAGMKDSKVIVAINQDEDAPMVKLADYSLVGDLFELVPELIQALPKSDA